MGNLGRAGYGASLEGTVCTAFFLTILLAITDAMFNTNSGPTRMTPVMWAQRRTKPSMAYHWQRLSTAIPAKEACFRTYLVKSCLGAHVQGKAIQGPSIQTERM